MLIELISISGLILLLCGAVPTQFPEGHDSRDELPSRALAGLSGIKKVCKKRSASNDEMAISASEPEYSEKLVAESRALLEIDELAGLALVMMLDERLP